MAQLPNEKDLPMVPFDITRQEDNGFEAREVAGELVLFLIDTFFPGNITT